MNAITKFFQHNWWTTLYINFKMLPLRQAIHLPIDICHKVRFESLNGRIIIDEKLPLRRAMFRIGGRGSEMFPLMQTVLSIDGEICMNGDVVEIGHGSTLIVTKSGRFSLGKTVRIGAFSKIYCTQDITMGNNIDLSWECQVYDTNFHTVQNIETKELEEPSGAISIGNNVWIGNRCTINKGTILPNDTIVASNSLLNKDYSSIPPYSMLAGMPAKIVKCGVKKTF